MSGPSTGRVGSGLVWSDFSLLSGSGRVGSVKSDLCPTLTRRSCIFEKVLYNSTFMTAAGQ